MGGETIFQYLHYEWLYMWRKHANERKLESTNGSCQGATIVFPRNRNTFSYLALPSGMRAPGLFFTNQSQVRVSCVKQGLDNIIV